MSVGLAGKLDGRLTCASRSSAGQPLCLIGDSGTGKSHLLIGLATCR
jgi:DNA replication protein DnaC